MDRAGSQTMRAAHTILDPAAVVKELVENALDACATRVDVRLRGRAALDSVTVSDNGRGVPPADFDALCLPSATSKLAALADLDGLVTFGFRGEALSAVCAIAERVTVTTRTDQSPVATALRYGNDAALRDRQRAARPVGTTVHVENVFHSLPVRRKDAVKNHAREIARCVAVVQALALISVSTRIELKVGGEVKVGNLPAMREPGVIPSGLGDVCLTALRHNAKSVLGARTARDLLEVATDKAAVVKIPPSTLASMHADGLGDGIDADAAYGCHGLVSKASLDANGGGGRARSSYQYIYVNRRPVDFPRLTRTIKDVYRRATGLSSAAPVVILNLVLPAWSCDVNLSPDKRVVCIHAEDTLISGIVSVLEALWIPTKTMSIPVRKDSDLTHLIQSSPKSPSTQKLPSQATEDAQMDDIPDEPELDDSLDMPMTNQNSGNGKVASSNDRTDLEQSESGSGKEGMPTPLPTNDNLPVSAESTPSNQKADVSPQATPATSDGEPSATPPAQRPVSLSPIGGEGRQLKPVKQNAVLETQPSLRRTRESLILASAKSSATRNVSSFVARRSNSFAPAKRPRSAKFSWPETKSVATDNINESTPDESQPSKNLEASEVVAEHPAPVFDEPRVEEGGPRCVATVHVDWDHICNQMSEGGGDVAGTQGNGLETGEGAFKDATIRDIDNELVNDAHHKAAEREMSRLFHQEWFKDFEILGQFNRGFIVTRLRNDLFIIDQHASDEKYNFEDLQRNTVISKQRLVQPLCLDFSAQDEVLVSQHLSAFRAGGFDIEYRDRNPPTRRLYLKAQPISKHTIFVQDDLRDIVDTLKSDVVQGSVMDIKVLRPPRVRAMFASRACRKSVMIGTALQKPQMTKIVRKLATLEHPWTCPHGRPTMRHLCSLPSGTV